MRLALALVLLLGCVDQPTQVLVRLATDIPDINTIVIRIYDDEDALVREQVLPPDRLSEVPADGRFHPIGTFGLVPQDDDPNRRFRVVIDVTVRREGTVRFETRARSGFVKNNTIRLDIFIAELCIDLAEMCEEEGLTCGIDGCVPEDIPPESLPPIDDDPIPDDPIDPRRFDGGFMMDAGIDAPVPDAAFDAATDTLGIDVGFFDGGVDAPVDAPIDVGLDAPFDGGLDAGVDAGPLVPGDDDAPILFPWSGVRFESSVPRIAFRGVPGIDHYEVVYRDYGETSTVPIGTSTDPGAIVVLDLPGITVDPGGRRIELQVLSCDGVFSCSSPLSQFRYVDLARVRCDLNNDGVSDPVVAQGDGQVMAWVNGTGLAPAVVDAHPGVGPTVTACADLDGDGDAELVSMQSVSGTAAVINWNGSSLNVVSRPFSATATSIIAADFDSDGFEDVVFADVNSGVVRYARGTSGPDLQSAVAIARHGGLAAVLAPGRFGRDLAITDVDTDGFADVIITDANDRDDVAKRDTGFQICYGGSPTAFSFCSYVPVPADDENFGWRVAGLGVSDEGRGGFAVAAPESGRQAPYTNTVAVRALPQSGSTHPERTAAFRTT